MQKKALILAVSAALVIPAAMAQKKGGDKGEKADPDSVVELYGKVYPELVFPSSSGATSAGTTLCTICGSAAGDNAIIKRTEMESSNSRFGLRGHEKLGGALKAIWQMETEFHVDSNDSRFAQRDSFVGLSHNGWGTVKLGRMDTPFKEYGDDLSFLGVSSGNFTSTSGIYRHIGFGSQNNAARFHERRVNVVQYETPDWGPFEAKIQWSTNEAKTATRDPRVLSMGGSYELGPAKIMVGYEVHWDLFGLSLNVPSTMRNTNDQSVKSKDEAVEVGVQFKFGAHTFEIGGNQKKYKEPNSVAGRVQSYQNNAYEFLWEARWTPNFRTAFQYVKATAGKCSVVNLDCNTNGLEGQQIGLGFAYHFSRRTYLFVMGTLVKNGYSAVFNNSNQQAPNPGEDVRQIGVGLHTAF
jgi:predicted porin